jgi:alcohol dehydrogenase class IV
MLVGTMNPEEGELRPQLLDRFGLCVQIEGILDPDQRVEVIRRRVAFEEDPAGFCEDWEPEQEKLRQQIIAAKKALPKVQVSDKMLYLIADIAVLKDPDTGRKQSIRWDWWLASTAVVDPVLTMTMPRQITAQSGMDALTHALEAYTSRWAYPMTDGLSLEATVLLCRNLYSAYSKGRDKEARQQVSLGSLMAGIALNNARVGLVHALAHPIGMRYHLAHGLVCAVLLPQVMKFNMSTVAEKYAQVARELHIADQEANSEAAAERLVHFIQMMQKRFEIPAKLAELGLMKEDIPGLAEATLPSGSLAANPRAVDYEDLIKILESNL